jgi:hypothetical protein
MHFRKNDKLFERAIFWTIILAAVMMVVVSASLLEFYKLQNRKAKATFVAIPTMTAESLEFLYQKGLGYINIQRWQEARITLERIFEVDPNYKDVQAKLIEIDKQIANSNSTSPPSLSLTPTPSPSEKQISDKNITTDGFAAYYSFDGNADDKSGEENDGFEYGGIEYIDGMLGEAAKFDGNNDFIDIPDSFFTEVTVSAFVRYDRDYIPPNDRGYKSISIVDGWTDRENFVLGIREENSQIMFTAGFHDYLDLNTCYQEIHVDSDTTLGSGAFYHTAMTYDGTILRLYVNGILENQITVNKNSPYACKPASNIPDIRIGVARRNTGWFYGVVDEVRVYNETLSSENILALYEQAIH